jgi:tetratricopeptide (TPR) repeat protein
MRMRNIGVVAALGVLAFVSTGCEKLKARDNLNKGVTAFKSAKYNQAVDHFKEAIRLDPDFTTARVYLATAYMSQYIPGAESEENMKLARAAEEEFLRVLKEEPNNALAIESLASLHYNQAQGGSLDQKMVKLDEAAKWYKRLAEADPNNKTAFYSLGVITWGKWYPVYQKARVDMGMKPEDPGPMKDPKVKAELKAKWLPVITEGIQNLERSLQIDPEYDQAMAYMNLLIRERADLADTKEEYAKDIEVADNWVQKALDTKKILAARAAENARKGIKMD